MDIKIVNKWFSLGLCDRRDSFPFSIVKMPYLCSNMVSKIFYVLICSNMLSKMFYVLIGAEILSIVRNSTKMEKLKSSYAKIISRMIKQESTISRINQCFCKIYGCSFETIRLFRPAFIFFLKI